MAPLSIRRLTTTALSVVLLERFALSTPIITTHEPSISNLTSIVDTVLGNAPLQVPTDASAAVLPQLQHEAQPGSHDTLFLSLPAFSTIPTPDELSPSMLRRAYVKLPGGQRQRVDLPSLRSASNPLIPRGVDDASPSPGAVGPPDPGHLTLASAAPLNRWMGALRDSTPLTALSIPGTHNSPTCHRALPSVRCQAVSPRKQLENGIRFFDVRVQPKYPANPAEDSLLLVHAAFPISLTGRKSFRKLVDDVLDFLRQNPSETVILSVKLEGIGPGTDAMLGRILKRHYTGDANDWWTDPRMPSLCEARKKIVLLRRFKLDDGLKTLHDGRGYAINAEAWRYNTPFDTCSGGDVCVQDFCEVTDPKKIDDKIRYCQQQLDRAACCRPCPAPGVEPPAAAADATPATLHVNFLSASNFGNTKCWPEKIAQRVNPAILEYLRQKQNEGVAGASGTGVVVCDWVGKNGNWDLVKCIVGSNSGVEVAG